MSKSEIRGILWKDDAELGIAFFCPHCHRFLCSSIEARCEYCGGLVDWDNKTQSKERIRWS